MPSHRLMFAVVTGILVSLAATPSASARQIDTRHPPVFSELSLDAAKQKAAEDGRILVVKGTAVWCGPCRTMDKTTWRDPKVEAWFKDNGIAIQVDVDKLPKQAKALRINAMPTMIAFKDGEEISRVVGMQSADELLAWLGRAVEGKKESDALMERLQKARADPKSVSMQDRLGLAEELARTGEPDEAADEFVWLWDNMLRYQSSMAGVRVSFMIGSMQSLAKEHEPAREKFQALRDREWKEFENKENATPLRREAVQDWAHLNKALDEGDKTLAWYDAAAKDPDSADFVTSIALTVRRLFEKTERWKDLGAVLDAPDEELESAYRIIELEKRHRPPQQDAKLEEMITQMNWRSFRDAVGRAYASYLAAGRDQDAAAIVGGAIERDDSPTMRVSLVRWALKAGQPREGQRVWLDEAAAAGEDWTGVRKALEDALAKAAPKPPNP